MKVWIKNESPVALYNCDKKECIGLFSKQILASKYLYKESKGDVSNSLRNKSRMRNTIFDFPVTARWCNAKQVKLMGEEKFIIMNGYYEPDYYQMKQFDFCNAGGFVKGGGRERGLKFLQLIGE